MLPTEPIISSSYLNAPDVMPKVRRSSQHARADLFKCGAELPPPPEPSRHLKVGRCSLWVISRHLQPLI